MCDTGNSPYLLQEESEQAIVLRWGMQEPASKGVPLELRLSCQMGERGLPETANTAQRPGCLGSSGNPGEPTA